MGTLLRLGYSRASSAPSPELEACSARVMCTVACSVWKLSSRWFHSVLGLQQRVSPETCHVPSNAVTPGEAGLPTAGIGPMPAASRSGQCCHNNISKSCLLDKAGCQVQWGCWGTRWCRRQHGACLVQGLALLVRQRTWKGAPATDGKPGGAVPFVSFGTGCGTPGGNTGMRWQLGWQRSLTGVHQA